MRLWVEQNSNGRLLSAQPTKGGIRREQYHSFVTPWGFDGGWDFFSLYTFSIFYIVKNEHILV